MERKNPGNHKIIKVFPDRKSLISDIPGFPAVDRDPSIMFLTVYWVFTSLKLERVYTLHSVYSGWCVFWSHSLQESNFCKDFQSVEWKQCAANFQPNEQQFSPHYTLLLMKQTNVTLTRETTLFRRNIFSRNNSCQTSILNTAFIFQKRTFLILLILLI